MSPSVCGSGGLTEGQTSPWKRNGSSSSNTGSASLSPGLVLHGCHVTVSVCQRRDGQQNRICASEKQIWRKHCMHFPAFIINFGWQANNQQIIKRKDKCVCAPYAHLFRYIYQFTYLIQYHYIIATYIFNVCSCVLFCMCESGGLAMSLADSGHLAEGFRDRQCLLSTITPILVPCLRCPCHSPGSPFTPEETL